MAWLRTLILVAVVTAVSAQTERARFCLNLLRSQNKAETVAALSSCVREVRASEERQGRQFKLDNSATFSDIGRCIAIEVGVLDQGGNVIKPELERRVRASRKISEQQRQEYLAEIPTCQTWDSCLKNKCKLN